MQKLSLQVAFGVMQLVLFLQIAAAQEATSAGNYLTKINSHSKPIAIDMLQYVSASAHDKSARKVEKRRKELIKTSEKAIESVSKMSDYKGDATYRDAVVECLRLAHAVFTDDYEKIVDIEEVASQSYDYMEAYLMAMELANQKLQAAYAKLNEAARAFAFANQVILVEDKSDLAKDLKLANDVNEHNNKVYLLMFKSYVEEGFLIESMNKGNAEGMNYHLGRLTTYTDESLIELEKMESYNGDNAVILACQGVLQFYKESASQALNTMVGFYNTKTNFEATQKRLESLKPADRTQADVDEYNALVKQYNSMISDFNKSSATFNNGKSKALNKYNQTASAFLAKYTPKYN